MAERTALTQVVQFGIETTPGVGVPATKRFQTIDFDTKVETAVDIFRPAGFKFTTVTAENKEWTSAGIKGQPTYTEMVYPLASCIVTPANPTEFLDTAIHTGVYKWIFEPSTTAPDPLTTFSIEQGSSVRAHRFTNGIISELGFNVSRDKIELTGKAFGQLLTDGQRTDTVTTGAASPNVIDTSIVAGDAGRPISGTNIAAGSYIVSVVPGASFVMNQNSSGAGTQPATIGGLTTLPGTTGPFTMGITSASATVTYASAALADVGKTISGTGIVAGSQILSAVVGVSYTISVPATATNAAASLTLSPTVIPLIPITGEQVSVYLDTTSVGLGTTKMPRLFDYKFSLANRTGPFWVVDAAQTSFAGTVEIVPKATVKVIVEADATGMALLNNLRNGQTVFMRLLAKGAALYSAGVYAAAPLTYQYQQDMALQVTASGSYSDNEGVYAIEFELEMVHDGAWGKAIHIEVQNKQATLV